MELWSFTLLTALAFGAPPRLTDLGTIVLDAPPAAAPRAFVLVNPPGLPVTEAAALPAAIVPLHDGWRSATDALMVPPPEGERSEAWGLARASAERLARERATALSAALEALPDADRDATVWLLMGQLRWHGAQERWTTAMVAFDACVAAGTADCPEPVLDVAHALEAWSHVGADAPTLWSWARGYSGHLLEQSGRVDEAVAAYREVVHSGAVSAELREWAGFQLGELLSSRGDAGARAAFELSATASDGVMASASRFRLLGLSLSDGRFEDAALIGLAWDLRDEEAQPFAPDVRELTVQALVRLGPTAPGLLATRREQGAVLRDVGTTLVEVAERHADGGRMSWGAALLQAPEVEALEDKWEGRGRLMALQGRFQSAPSDDARSWGRRVISWCATRLTTDTRPFALTLTVRGAAAGRAPTVRLSRMKGDADAFGRCLAGLIPPPEGKDAKSFRGDLVYLTTR